MAEFPVYVNGYSNFRPRIVCSWEGRCLVTESYKVGSAEEWDIRGRLLYYFGQFLPLVTRLP